MPNWVQQTSGTTQKLNHVYGFGPVSVFAVGDLGTILFWNGSKWLRRNSNTSRNLNKVWGASIASVWVVGSSGTMLNSIDGGVTWSGVGTLNAALGFAGEFVGLWGSSATDFWVLENTNGGFWHTTDGGTTWTLVATFKSAWSHLWGATGNYIIAAGVTGPTAGPTAGSLAYWNGSSWTAQTEASGQVNGRGCWPFGTTGASAQNFSCGSNNATGPASIKDWTQSFSSGVYDVVPPQASGAGARYNSVYGFNLVDLYAVGANASGSSLLSQVAAAGTPTVSGSWSNVVLPSTLPALLGGLTSVFAGASSYAVAVGFGGAIVARPGAPLAVTKALAIATNTVQVTLSAPPLAQSPIVAGDALNPATWLVLRTDTNAGFNVMTVVQVSPTVFNVIIFDRFASALVQHQVSAPTMIDPFGNVVGSTVASAIFQGVVADA